MPTSEEDIEALVHHWAQELDVNVAAIGWYADTGFYSGITRSRDDLNLICLSSNLTEADENLIQFITAHEVGHIAYTYTTSVHLLLLVFLIPIYLSKTLRHLGLTSAAILLTTLGLYLWVNYDASKQEEINADRIAVELTGIPIETLHISLNYESRAVRNHIGRRLNQDTECLDRLQDSL